MKPYSPANHTGTRNYRLVASKNVEVLIGKIEKGEGALPHSHPGIEQVAYLLEGTAEVEWGGEIQDAGGRHGVLPGRCPAPLPGHVPKVRVMVIYTPPYLEKPENVRR